MGLIKQYQSWRTKRALKRFNSLKKMFGSSILSGEVVLGDENILTSSEIYHYMTAIANMFACGKWVIEDREGTNKKSHECLKLLNNPNGYLSGFEFKKLLTNVYLLEGEAFIVKDGGALHIIKGIEPSINEFAQKQYNYNGNKLYPNEVAQVKNMGLSINQGVGIIDLAKNTLEGVLNAEHALNEKYKKGGLLAYLVELEAHLSPKNTMQNAMVEAVQEKLEEIQDEGKTVVIPLSKGYKIKAFESPVDDEKSLKYLSIYKKDLAKFLGFDPDAYSQLLKTDLEKASLYLKAFVVDPWVTNVCEALTNLLFKWEDNLQVSFYIDLDQFLTMSQKITNASNLVRSMVYTPDDGRVSLGKERLDTEESSRLYSSKDLIAADQLGALNEAKTKNEGGEAGG
ncbi:MULTISPECIES: phage portal protein [Jeotgalibaca]|uniref:phage portal protein n=1 Tax=Jeotgalibaca TaxID=1470540 RepID=UPI0035A0B42C